MNPYDTNPTPPDYLRERDIFTRIWLEPRLMFRYIDAHQHEVSLWMLLVLNGMVRAFDRAQQQNAGDKMSLMALVLLCIIGGSLGGWLSVYIYAWLISKTGKWLGGTAEPRALLRVFAYAGIPSALTLLLLIVQIGLYGERLFQEDNAVLSNGFGVGALGSFTFMVQFALQLWTASLFVIATAELQRFSTGKAILNLVLPALILIAVVLLIVLSAKLL